MSKERLRKSKEKLIEKLADPKDTDHPRWVKDALKRVEKRLAKKEKASEHKRQQQKVGRNRRPT